MRHHLPAFKGTADYLQPTLNRIFKLGVDELPVGAEDIRERGR